MHQRVRCAACHHWTDALLVWAAGDCCPCCNAPIRLGEPGPVEVEEVGRDSVEQSPPRIGRRSAEWPRRSTGRLGDPSRLGERQR